MRIFCKSTTLQNDHSEYGNHHSSMNGCYLKRSIELLKNSNVYELMAKKIQRAWRRYRTHKIINMYATTYYGYMHNMHNNEEH